MVLEERTRRGPAELTFEHQQPELTERLAEPEQVAEFAERAAVVGPTVVAAELGSAARVAIAAVVAVVAERVARSAERAESTRCGSTGFAFRMLADWKLS